MWAEGDFDYDGNLATRYFSPTYMAMDITGDRDWVFKGLKPAELEVLIGALVHSQKIVNRQFKLVTPDLFRQFKIG